MIKTDALTPRQKKVALIVAALVVLYLLFGFIGMPFIVRGILENQVAAAIQRQVAVESVRVNPLTLSVTLRNLSVREGDDTPFVAAAEVYANLQTSSLFKWALVLKSVRLTQPDIHLVRSGAATFNFSDIGAGGNAAQTAPAESAEGKGMALAIYDVRIAGGTIALDDRVVGVRHRIEAFDLHLSDFSSRPADTDVYTLFQLAARVNGADLSIQGNNSPLAAFYLHELEETAATIIEAVGEYDGHPVSALTEHMLLPALSGLEVAIGAGEADEGMVNLVEACNACHAATEHAFIVIGRAKGNPFNQVFEGQR